MRDRHDRRNRSRYERVRHRPRTWRRGPESARATTPPEAKPASGRTRHGPVALKTVLTEAAQAAGRTKNTYLGARYHAIRGRRGTFKAVGAIRHDILIAYWHIVGLLTFELSGSRRRLGRTPAQP